jgi:folate-dependent phosphoribosylglycinamide formyltransferase PurN
MTNSEPIRVLFVGSELNPMSIEVLGSLAHAEDLELSVLVSQPLRRGVAATLRRGFREEGLLPLLRGGLRLIRARSRMFARKLGIEPAGFASLSEVVEVRGLEEIAANGINAKATVERIRQYDPHLLLVSAFDQILKAPVLAIPKLGCVNVHPSLLPARRGSNPFYWVIRNGDAQSGVTFHMIDEGIDTGDLLAQTPIDIAPGETERTLQRRSAKLAGQMATDIVRGLRDATLAPKPQPEAGAGYDPKPPRGASSL